MVLPSQSWTVLQHHAPSRICLYSFNGLSMICKFLTLLLDFVGSGSTQETFNTCVSPQHPFSLNIPVACHFQLPATQRREIHVCYISFNLLQCCSVHRNLRQFLSGNFRWKASAVNLSRNCELLSLGDISILLYHIPGKDTCSSTSIRSPNASL